MSNERLDRAKQTFNTSKSTAKTTIREIVMSEVLLPMQNGGTKRLQDLHRKKRQFGLSPQEAKERDELGANALLVHFFSETRIGKTIVDWLVE